MLHNLHLGITIKTTTYGYDVSMEIDGQTSVPAVLPTNSHNYLDNYLFKLVIHIPTGTTTIFMYLTNLTKNLS